MTIIRAFYDRLPQQTRSAIRALLPRRFLLWYAHRNTDAYLVSYPKCGRTWLRLMIGRAIAGHFKLPFDEDTLLLNWKRQPHPQAPRIQVVHDNRPMLKAPEELETSKDRYRGKKVIFLVRDPRDVIVSSYFEMKKRGHLFGENPYEEQQAVFDGSLAEFIHRRKGGFDTILRYYNIWLENRDVPGGLLLVRYEDLKTDPQAELRRVMDFLGLQQISDATVAEAAEFASFDNMRKMEALGQFQSSILKPANRSDQESYKTRKGKVGGYAEHLDENQIQEMNEKMRRELSGDFGYLSLEES